MGLRIDDAVRHWCERRPWEGMTPVEVERAVTARVAELIEAEGTPMPGALEVVDLVPRPGDPDGRVLGLVRRGHRGGAGQARADVAMAAWHSAEWEPLGKPHPGPTCRRRPSSGVDPTACLAFEDSFNGAISAKAARMRVVAVPEPAALGSPRWGFCDLVLGLARGVRRGRAASLGDPAAEPARPDRRARRRPAAAGPGRADRDRLGCKIGSEAPDASVAHAAGADDSSRGAVPRAGGTG